MRIDHAPAETMITQIRQFSGEKLDKRRKRWPSITFDKKQDIKANLWYNISILREGERAMGRNGSRYVVFLFKADQFSGELASSAEGRVFWLEKDEVLKTNWIWHMDGLIRIMADGQYTELYLDVANDWKPVLK